MATRANADEADEQAEQRVRRGPDDREQAKWQVQHVLTIA
jgi:hypothetical protein